jgi:L-amino acid N-acyltransferase YncA
VTRLRLAAAADFEGIAAITNHYIRTTTIHFGREPVTADELRAEWQAAEHHPWLCAVTAGDTVLGYAKAGVFRSRAAYRWTTETGIYLDPDHCRQGLGTALYERLLAVLRAQGYHTAVGGIVLPNRPSVQMHERLGFRPSGVIVRAGRKFDRWHDLGFWQLLLQGEDHAPGPLLPPAAAFFASEPD